MKTGASFFENLNVSSILVLTEPELHIIRTALGSVLKEKVFTQDNTPPMPLYDAHLGGFFFLDL